MWYNELIMALKKLPKLLIIDGNALIHRSFHALPASLKTTKGEIVNAVYGFTSFLLKAIKELKPEMIVLTLDKKGTTFRHEAYKEYKATRVKAPDELYEQIPRVKEVAEALEIPIFEIAGCEADDVIGTIVEKIGDKAEKIIVTGDMDTLQLIDDHTKIYTMSRGLADSVIYDEKAVHERFGLDVSQMIDYKALRGDPSDNIPGVRGIGEKTAIELLKNFDSIKNLYKNLNSKKISPRLKELLTTYKEDAFMSYDLATIKRDIAIKLDEKKMIFGEFNRDKALELFKELEFRSLVPRLLQLENTNKAATIAARASRTDDKYSRNQKDCSYTIIDDEKAFASFVKKIKTKKQFAFDTETSDLDSFTSDLLGMSFSWAEGEAYFLSLRLPSAFVATPKKASLFDSPKKTAASRQGWLDQLKPIFENEKIDKIGHNAKFDIKILKAFGIEVKGVTFDTMIAAYVLNSGQRQYSLDSVAMEYLEFEKISSEELLGTGKTKLTFSTVPLDKLGSYACEDADITWRLAEVLRKNLKKEKLDILFNKMEMPLIEALTHMELMGISLDERYFKNLDKELDTQIAKTEKAIFKACGQQFNIASPKQLQEVLFTKLKISSAGLSRTKTGISTGAEELLKLKGRHEVIELILNYRELTKLSSTYVKTLPQLVNPITHRVHTNFNQTIAATGRLSSINPNLQNIPVRTEMGRRIRRGFIAQKGHTLISLDYSQIELRLAAHISGDPKMISAFKKGEDIHAATAAAVNQIPIDKVSPELRRRAKAVNFGILYGQGPHGLAQSADIPYEEARDFIDNYFATYTKIDQYIHKTLEQARKTGYVETLFGRRRYIEEINASNAMIRKAAERMAINAPIQGAAADMIKLAMIKIDELIEKKYHDTVHMLLQVHDELVFESEPSVLKKAVEDIKQIMENVIKLAVPIIVDAKAGDNWEEMKKI